MRKRAVFRLHNPHITKRHWSPLESVRADHVHDEHHFSLDAALDANNCATATLYVGALWTSVCAAYDRKPCIPGYRGCVYQAQKTVAALGRLLSMPDLQPAHVAILREAIMGNTFVGYNECEESKVRSLADAILGELVLWAYANGWEHDRGITKYRHHDVPPEVRETLCLVLENEGVMPFLKNGCLLAKLLRQWPDEEQFLRYFAGIFDALKKPFPERTSELAAVEQEYELLSSSWWYRFAQVDLEYNIATRLCLGALAISEYRLAHGHCPNDLSEVDVRCDPCTNEPFTYRFSEEGYMLAADTQHAAVTFDEWSHQQITVNN